MDVAGISRPVLVVLSAVAVLLLAAGGSWALSWATHKTQTSTRTIAAAKTVEIDGRSGDVRVIGTDRSDILLTTKEQRSVLGGPHSDVSFSDGRLHLDGGCPDFQLWGNDAGCSISYTLEVPRDTAVHLATQSGDVSAQDIAGDADLETRSGDVDASGIGGALRLQTRSGDVDADSSSTDISASSRSGDVDVRARNATRVLAQTRSGDVDVSVPDRTYAVQAAADSGDETVDVSTDRRSPRTIVATTASGDVHVSRDG
jgi:putative adhesin